MTYDKPPWQCENLALKKSLNHSESHQQTMSKIYRIVHYVRNGKDIFQNWLDELRDLKGRTIIARRIKRTETGNFGTHKPCRDGVWELTIDTGPGYRVYYSVIQNVIILLLCAGDKHTQQKDIDKAIEYLKDFRRQNDSHGYKQS